MASNWNEVRLTNLVPPEARSIVDAVTTLTSTLTSFLNVVKAGLEISKTFAAAASSNPVEAALESAVSEIETFIDGLTKSTTAHAIFVPIQKNFFGKGNRVPKREVGDADLPPTYEQLRQDDAFAGQSVSSIPKTTIKFINDSPTAQGGNEGFWKALMSSLKDEGDMARPVFPNTHAVGGVCILFGADSLEDLQKNFSLFNQIIKAGARADLAARTRPSINGVRIKALPLASEGRIGVQLDWDVVPPVINFSLYSDEAITNEEIFVVRSTNPKLRERFAWSENFSREPTDDSSDLQSEEDVKVIARLRNDGFVRRYIDRDASLTVGTTYYYGLAIRYTMNSSAQPMGNFSAVRRIQYTGKPQSSRAGEAPDWWATPSLIQLFPVLDGLIGEVKLALSSLSSRTGSNSGAQSIITQTIRQVDSLISQGEKLLANLNAVTSKIDALLAGDLTALTTSTIITVNKGGMEGWAAELAQRLSDTTDPTRPPFDNGELVAGIVIVAGAPNLPQLEDFLALLRLLFGASDNNPILRALDAVDALVAEQEDVSFTDGFTPVRSPATPVPAAETDDVPILFDESMRRTDSIDC